MDTLRNPIQGRALVWYLAVVFIGFGLFYLLTRSSILVGDARGFIDFARAADPAQLHYGEPNHFLQVPLARAVWRILDAFGVQVSLGRIFVGFSFAGTLVAIAFVGLIAAELLHTREAGWLAAILFGTSLHASTQWNGELYGMALAFVTAGLFLTLRGRVIGPAFLWALAVLSHSDFVMAAPAFVAAVWMARPGDGASRENVRRALMLLVVAGTATCVAMLLGSWILGKWFDARSFVAWLARAYESRQQDVSSRPEVFRAIKGLVTAYTVAGHYWRDILSGRGQYSMPWFVPAATVGLFVLLLTGALLAAATRRPGLFLFALVWLLPFHVLVNWWFVPTVEKYHAGALPGFVLLVTGGLVHLGSRLSTRGRLGIYLPYVAAFAGLNLFGAVLPMQAIGQDATRAELQIRRLADEREGRAVFIACDASGPLVGAGVSFLRIRSIWRGTLPEIEGSLTSWTRDRLREGKEPYLVGRWCLPEGWKTTWSKAPFDLQFLGRSFEIRPTGITGIPIAQSVPTNPFSWTRGDVARLSPTDVVFNSFAFFVFFPVVTVLYFALSHRWRWALLLSASCAFYMFFIPKYILILFFTIGVDYAAGILIEQAQGRRRKSFLVCSIVANVGVLAFFKYVNFITDNTAALARLIGWNYSIHSLSIILPIGLSFHTFQAMSYTIEVYRGRQKAERHLGIYALYVMFYPQLVAGPIERPQHLLPQFYEVHEFDYGRVTGGLKLMAWGLFKKAVVADRLAWVVNFVYGDPSRFPGPVLAVATVFFAFQIYYDFSGYSDIAIGAARVMGFSLRRNFDSPYQSQSTAEFWRRWHMSLSSWFKDYVFRPTRDALARRVESGSGYAVYAVAVAITFLLSGLWHGANWTFVFWGALNGAYLILSAPTRPARERIRALVGLREHSGADRAVKTVATFALITFSWIFFRARSFHEAALVCRGLMTGWGAMLTPSGIAETFRGVGLTVAAAGVAGAVAVETVQVLQLRLDVPALVNAQPWWARWGLYYAGMASLYFLYANEGQFIYFQF